jgi:hypothetical protein
MLRNQFSQVSADIWRSVEGVAGAANLKSRGFEPLSIR